MGGIVFAAAYDAVAAREDRRGAAELRQALASGAVGEVLEIGVGTGRCLPYYRAARRIVALEPHDGMRSLARLRARRAPVAHRRGRR